jgi:hypothetical protein
MPVPSVEEWEWLNWKFPRPVHAGDTIYARWTLTQKRPPIGGAATSIVVWRVDVHTLDGALCAEGEVGAKVRRQIRSKESERPAPEPAATGASGASGTSTAAPRRRRRRRPAGATVPVTEPAAVPAPLPTAARPERAAGAPRRRRRRRPAGGSATHGGEQADGSPPPPAQPAPAPALAQPSSAAAERGGLSGVIRRLRQPRKA